MQLWFGLPSALKTTILSWEIFCPFPYLCLIFKRWILVVRNWRHCWVFLNSFSLLMPVFNNIPAFNEWLFLLTDLLEYQKLKKSRSFLSAHLQGAFDWLQLHFTKMNNCDYWNVCRFSWHVKFSSSYKFFWILQPITRDNGMA